MTLSKKRLDIKRALLCALDLEHYEIEGILNLIKEQDKEFIKELKELIKNNWRQDINEQINNE